MLCSTMFTETDKYHEKVRECLCESMEDKEAKAKAKRDMIDVYEPQLKGQFKHALAYSHLKDSPLFKDVRTDVNKLRKKGSLAPERP